MTQSNKSLPFFEILDIVRSEFETENAYSEEDMPTFMITQTPLLKEKFERLRSKLNILEFDIIKTKLN